MFPGQEHSIRKLLVGDVLFREVCDDYMAALRSLNWFRSLPGSDERLEVAEFTSLSDSLLREMKAIVASNLNDLDPAER
jgi:hypothetical protein